MASPLEEVAKRIRASQQQATQPGSGIQVLGSNVGRTQASTPAQSAGAPSPSPGLGSTGFELPTLPDRNPLDVGGLPSFRDPNFDPAFAKAERGLRQALAGLQSQEEFGERRIGEQFGEFSTDLERQHEDIRESIRERMASQGLLRSGIFVGEQGEAEEEFQHRLGRLTDEKARALEDLSRAILGRRQGILGELETLEEERARQVAQRELERERQEQERLRRERQAAEEAKRQKRLQAELDKKKQSQLKTVKTQTPKSSPQPKSGSSPSRGAVSRRVSGGGGRGSSSSSQRRLSPEMARSVAVTSGTRNVHSAYNQLRGKKPSNLRALLHGRR